MDLKMISSDKTLILFTSSFPYDPAVKHAASEQTFLTPEIKHLAAGFQRVIIVPSKVYGKRYGVPEGVEVDESLGLDRDQENDFLRRLSSAVSAFSSPLFYRDIFSKPMLYPRAIERLLAAVGWAVRTRKWVCRFLERENLDLNRTVFYSYWLNSTALGIGQAKRYFPELKLVSRAHGFDLYEERHTPPYIPCRSSTLKELDRLFNISAHGRNYIVGRYPQVASLCEVSRLGVEDPGFVSKRSSDDVFRVVSCSSIVPVKRLSLLARGIEAAAQSRPGKAFEWHHLGDGPERILIEDTAKKISLKNVKYSFQGQLAPEKVMAFYRDNPVDVFINVSSTEGLPVSIMEAQSCGIPVIAPEICGIPEIVSHKNGILLSRNPLPEEVAEAILKIKDNPSSTVKMRKRSQGSWQSKCYADNNYALFTKQLLSLI